MHWVQVSEWIPQETISSPWKELKVESNCFLVSIWHHLVFCVNSSLVGGWGPMFFGRTAPPIYPFFKTVVTCDVFFFQKLMTAAAGLELAFDTQPLTLPPHNLDDVLLGEGEKKPDTEVDLPFVLWSIASQSFPLQVDLGQVSWADRAIRIQGDNGCNCGHFVFSLLRIEIVGTWRFNDDEGEYGGLGKIQERRPLMSKPTPWAKGDKMRFLSDFTTDNIITIHIYSVKHVYKSMQV